MKLYPLLTPAGSDGQVQYNNNGLFGGDSTLTFNDATKVLASTGTIDGSAGKVLVEDNDTSEPTDESDGYIGVAIIGGQPRLYWTVNGIMYYVEGSSSAVPAVGNPIGLLLVWTYAA